MGTLKVWTIGVACVAAFATPLLDAQAAADAPPPPVLEPLEEGEAPAITIRKQDQQGEITEKRAPDGRVTEIKVTSGNRTYYLKPNTPAGSAMPGDTLSSQNRAAQWEVLVFELGPTKEQQEAAAAEATANVPPPPEAPTRPP